MRLILTLAAALVLSAPASAQVTCQQFGEMTVCTYPDGRTVTCQNFGTIRQCW